MFKVNDWVIHDYEIKQVLKAEDGIVNEVSCGNFITSGSNLVCRKLTLKSKNIASVMKYYYKQIQALPGSNGLNFPQINGYLCEKCIKAIDAGESGDTATVNRIYSDVKDFFRTIEEKLTEENMVDGVRIFR